MSQIGESTRDRHGVLPKTGLPSPPPNADGGEPKWRSRRPRLDRRSRQEARAAYLFLAPWFAGLALITIGPMVASLYLSFTDYSVLSSPDWVGLDNYKRLFTQDARFIRSIIVTAVYVFASVPLLLIFALFLAIVLNTGIRFLGIYRAVFYLPSLLGTSVSISIVWRRVFGSQGLVNAFLARLGIEGPSWIGHPDYALWTLIILNVWTFGSAMIIFLAGLRQVPQSLYEAAAIDGAGKWRRFVHITVPVISPVILFNLVLNVIAAFQAFTPAFIISGGTGGPVDSTLFYTLYLYQQGFARLNMGYASAMAWILLATIAATTALLFLGARRWVFYGDR